MKLIRPLAMTPAALIASNVAEADYPAWSAATSYAAAERVIVLEDHTIYESLTSANLNQTPGITPTAWKVIGATNRWRMFDYILGSQTSNPDSITVSLLATGRCDAIALLNVVAASARFVMTDAVDGVVYDKTYSLVSVEGIADWYSYFFEPIFSKTDLVELELPPYANVTLTITLAAAGSMVACGACVIGQQRTLGGTQYGAKIGIQDYSGKTRDAQGNYAIAQRAFSKRATFTLQIDSRMVDHLQTLLAGYRSTPIVYIGSELYGATMLYGFYKDFSVDIDYANTAFCSLELEGLT